MNPELQLRSAAKRRLQTLISSKRLDRYQRKIAGSYTLTPFTRDKNLMAIGQKLAVQEEILSDHNFEAARNADFRSGYLANG